MKKKRLLKIIAITLTLVMCIGLIAACTPNDTPSVPITPPTGGAPEGAVGADTDENVVVLQPAVVDDETNLADYIQVIVDNNNIAVLDPHMPASAPTSTNWVFTMIHDRLIQNFPTEDGFSEGLATRWHTEDMQTYTFTLRQGVTFHNGDAFTAEDVIYTINRVQADGLGSPAFDIWRPVVSATAPDPFTLVLELDEVDVDFLFGISRPPAGILNRRAIEADSERGPHVGTGAFSVEEFMTLDFALLRANPNYWGTPPVTELVRLRFVPEMATRTIMMQTGDAHLSFGTPADDMQWFLDNDDFLVFTTTSNDPQGLAFNLNDPITGDYYFRRAVAHAIDRPAIAFGAAGQWADGNLADGAFWGFGTEFRNTDIPLPERNLDLAREYLARSSYNGEEVEIAAAIITFIRMAQGIAMQLSEIGINAVVNEMEAPALAAHARYGGNHQMVCFFTLINPSAGSARHAFIEGGGQNRASFNDPRVTELLDEARRTIDEDARAEMYREVQAIVAETLAYQNILWRVFGNVAVNGLGGIIANPDPASHDFRNIYMIVEN
ncbi:MAG: ABC transporter substrate-binding protein [Oscillospiraceae bacterium]|nr:ABC transporter substrate-binding protein [Oscillospiraceae bacterium]